MPYERVFITFEVCYKESLITFMQLSHIGIFFVVNHKLQNTNTFS